MLAADIDIKIVSDTLGHTATPRSRATSKIEKDPYREKGEGKRKKAKK